jgi:hypothetical protein
MTSTGVVAGLVATTDSSQRRELATRARPHVVDGAGNGFTDAAVQDMPVVAAQEPVTDAVLQDAPSN